MKVSTIFNGILRNDEDYVIKLIAFAKAYEDFLETKKNEKFQDIDDLLPEFCRERNHRFEAYLPQAKELFTEKMRSYSSDAVIAILNDMGVMEIEKSIGEFIKEKPWRKTSGSQFLLNAAASISGSIILFCIISGVTMIILNVTGVPENMGPLQYIGKSIDEVIR